MELVQLGAECSECGLQRDRSQLKEFAASDLPINRMILDPT